MKKLLFFFSMLFFFSLSKVSALDNYTIDFRSVSTEPIFSNSINYLNTTACSGSSYCSGTYVETLEKTISTLESEGYSIYIRLNKQDDLFGGSANFRLYVFDLTKTDVSNFVLTSVTSSSSEMYLDLKLKDDSSIYYWLFFSNSNVPFNNFDNIIDTVSTTEPISADSLTFLNILDSDGANYYFGSPYPYYLSDSVKITYEFNNSFDIYNDFVTNINVPLTINSTSGFATNYLFYLRTYTSHDIFAPPENPGEDTPSDGEIINDNIMDSDVGGASDSFGGFFDNFEDDNYGLSDIIKTPLTFIQGLSTQTCTPITLPLPFVDQNLILPCIKPIFQEHFSPLLTVYQLITFGIISYFIVINIFKTVRGFKNPDSNNVEVLEL